MIRTAAIALFGMLGALWIPDGAQAETLEQALASAYSNNPTLQARRAQQRALDESVSQARAGWRPTVTASGSVSESCLSGCASN